MANAPLFDPAEGTLVRQAPKAEPGWWAGAPSANFDASSNTFYLVYRYRQPREMGRGVECRIAVSDNGITFTDIWALPKTSFDAVSIERCSLTRAQDGEWILYISYVNPVDNRWQISLIESFAPDTFDVGNLRPLFTAESTRTDGVKDPNVFLIGPMYYMLVSYGQICDSTGGAAHFEKHGTGDVFNTGLTLSRTAAAISGDGRNYRWIGDVSPKGGSHHIASSQSDHMEMQSAWDWYCRRTSTLVSLDGGGYMALYDGSASVAQNYEEKTGLALSHDLRQFISVTADAPAIITSNGSGSVRYTDVLRVGRELFYYYEVTRENGSHDLCVNVVET